LNSGYGMSLLRSLIAALVTVPFVASQSVCATLDMAHPDAPAAPVSAGRAAAMLNKKPRNAQAAAHPASRPKTGVAATRRGAATTAISSRRAAAQIPGSANRAGVVPTAAGGATRGSLSPGPVSAAPNRTPPRSAGALQQSSAVRKGTLGGPRAQGYARLGGPASGKAAQAAVLDGTQLPRRRY
jgi:hypothetical protein